MMFVFVLCFLVLLILLLRNYLFMRLMLRLLIVLIRVHPCCVLVIFLHRVLCFSYSL